MAITIIAIPGASNSNSFCNELEFIAYAATRLNVPAGTTVSGSTCSETEKAALIEAQRELTNLPWEAQRTIDGQALAWPQRYCLNPDAPAVTGISDIAQLYFEDGLPVTAGAFVVGKGYTIVSVGTTDFTLIGAGASTIGVQFTATGVGAGTGTAALTASVPTRVKHAQIELALEFVRAGTTDLAANDPNEGVIEETVGPLTTRWSEYARQTGLARFPRVVAYIAPMLATTAGSLEVARS